MIGPVLLAFAEGLALSGGLIIAIGAQNAFVLRQGLRRRHVLPVALVCSLSDSILIWLGTYAAAMAAERLSIFATLARYGGAAFLLCYGAVSAWKAFSNKTLDVAGHTEAGLSRTLAVCAGFTFLNPHVYLDTCVLIGSVASQYAPSLRFVFALGASTASFVWFFGLAYGARLLTPVFARPTAWRALDAAIAIIMVALAMATITGR
jgi:L-lysine exporter family protein LysE/ArgO